MNARHSIIVATGSHAAPSVAGAFTNMARKIVQQHLVRSGILFDLQFPKAKVKVAHQASKINIKSGEAVDKWKLRVGNAIAALKGKKFTGSLVEDHAGFAC